MFAEVILPVPVFGTFTYQVPSEQEMLIEIGSLVSVPFGKTNYTGVVFKTNTTPLQKIKHIRSISKIISAEPTVHPLQLNFWEWMARYYICTLGEIFRNVLPSIVRSTKKQAQRSHHSKTANHTSKIYPLHTLNELQHQAYDQIVKSFRKKNVCLLHGATASRKTEIYTHLIRDTLDTGRQVLYLLPEIIQTVQITNQLQRFFGNQMNVFHSKINDKERSLIWNKLLNDGQDQLILGVRSSIFLPFLNLGLIIIDEEHESSYKQQDQAPRYHARNAAIMLAAMHGAKVVLGSATPSLESYYNAKSGKYGYVRLNKCFDDVGLQTITSVDIRELRRKKMMRSVFSPLLIERMQTTLDNGEQILLFQNRRGFALNLVCKICDWTPQCQFCDVGLVYHKTSISNTGVCHYCGRIYQLPTVCSECGSDLQLVGYGTEKVEEEIQTLFPNVAVARLDTDTAKTSKSIGTIISRFASREIQILIGTQMISQSLNFEKVGLIGILNVETLMNFPNFRAHERAFQLILQIASCSGLRKTPSEVILQTSHPDHPLIQAVLQHDYEQLYTLQTEERALFHYPPFSRLIDITIKHRDEDIVRMFANKYANLLRDNLGDRVVGPDKPSVGKIKNLYLQKLLLKIEPSASLQTLRNILKQAQQQVSTISNFRYVVIQYDVDPI